MTPTARDGSPSPAASTAPSGPPPAASESALPAIRVLLGGVAALMVLAAAVTVAGALAVRDRVETHALTGPISAVHVSTEVGDIRTRPAGPGEQPRLDRRVQWSFWDPATTFRAERGRVEAAVHCPPISLMCSSDVELIVPPGAAIEARTGVGDVVVVRADSTVAAEASVGDVEVSLDAAARQVQAVSDTGDVTVRVAPGQSYAVQADTDVGTRELRVASDPASGRVVIARTATGDVRVLAAR